MHKGYCIKIANFVHPLQVRVARFKAIDVRVASGFRSQVKTRSIICNCCVDMRSLTRSRIGMGHVCLRCRSIGTTLRAEKSGLTDFCLTDVFIFKGTLTLFFGASDYGFRIKTKRARTDETPTHARNQNMLLNNIKNKPTKAIQAPIKNIAQYSLKINLIISKNFMHI